MMTVEDANSSSVSVWWDLEDANNSSVSVWWEMKMLTASSNVSVWWEWKMLTVVVFLYDESGRC